MTDQQIRALLGNLSVTELLHVQSVLLEELTARGSRARAKLSQLLSRSGDPALWRTVLNELAR